jgi:hypothetical protein
MYYHHLPALLPKSTYYVPTKLSMYIITTNLSPYLASPTWLLVTPTEPMLATEHDEEKKRNHMKVFQRMSHCYLSNILVLRWRYKANLKCGYCSYG